jgi:ABC-2 type transport system permease protein
MSLLSPPRPAAPTARGRGGAAAALATAVVIETRAAAWLAYRELLRYRRQPVRLLATIVAPALILISFGVGLSQLLPGDGGVDYAAYLFPGTVAMAVMLPAFASATSVMTDRQSGFLRLLISSPVRRVSLTVGRVLGGGVSAALQGAAMCCLAPLVGVVPSPAALLRLLAAIGVLAFAATSLAVLAAVTIRQPESLQMILNLVVNPMFFLSGATFPLDRLPPWLALVTKVNPVTYAVDAIRRALSSGTLAAPPARLWGWVVPVWAELLLVSAIGALLLAATVRRLRRMT